MNFLQNYRSIGTNAFRLCRFPSVNNAAREKWVRFVKRDRKEENWYPSAASKLCSRHFRTEDIYYGKTGRAILIKGAVPFTTNEAPIASIRPVTYPDKKAVRKIELDGTIATEPQEYPSTSGNASPGTFDQECCCCHLALGSANAPLHSHCADPQFSLYADMLRDCFHLAMVEAERETALICEDCVDRLRDAASFKQQVQQSQVFMRACSDVCQEESHHNEPEDSEDEDAMTLVIKTEDDDEEDDQNEGSMDMEEYSNSDLSARYKESATESGPPPKKQKTEREESLSEQLRTDIAGTHEGFPSHGCGCSKRCFERFSKDQITAFRSECADLDTPCEAVNNQLDQLIMSALPADADDSGVHALKGLAVCKQFFIYAYNITEKRYNEIVRRFRQKLLRDSEKMEVVCPLEPGIDPLKEEIESDTEV